MADEDVIAVLSGRGDQTKQKSVTEGRLIAGVACGRTCGIDVGSGAIQRPAEGAARQKVVETAVAWGGPRRRKGREQQKRKAEQRCCGHVVFSQMKSSKAYVQICSAARCVKNERARAAALGAPGGGRDNSASISILILDHTKVQDHLEERFSSHPCPDSRGTLWSME